MNKEDIKLLGKVKEAISISLGIIAIWYIQDIRIKLMGVVLCIWGAMNWKDKQ